MSKNKFRIFPEHTYQLEYLDANDQPYIYEVEGTEIIASFRRQAYLQELFAAEVDEMIDEITEL